MISCQLGMPSKILLRESHLLFLDYKKKKNRNNELVISTKCPSVSVSVSTQLTGRKAR